MGNFPIRELIEYILGERELLSVDGKAEELVSRCDFKVQPAGNLRRMRYEEINVELKVRNFLKSLSSNVR